MADAHGNLIRTPLSERPIAELGVDGDDTQQFLAHSAERRAASRVVRQNEQPGHVRVPPLAAAGGGTPGSAEPHAEPASEVSSTRSGSVVEVINVENADAFSVRSHSSVRSIRSTVHQA